VLSFAAAKTAAETPVNGPAQLAFDSAGDLYISEYFGHKIIKIDFNTGIVSVVAGNGRECCYEENRDSKKVSVYQVESLAVDNRGNVYFGGRNARDGAFVRKIDNGLHHIITLAGSLSARSPASASGSSPLEINVSDPKGLVTKPSGALLVSTDQSNQIVQIDSTAKTLVGGALDPDLFKLPGSLAQDKNGNILVADYLHHCIKRVDAQSHVVTTVAGNGSTKESGDGGEAVKAGIPYPVSIAVSSTGDIYVLENSNHRIRRIDANTGIIKTIAGTGEAGFTTDGIQASIAKISPVAIALDSQDNLYFSEIDNNRVRRIDRSSGILTTVAGNGLPKRKIRLE
jgi:streptogramin lyase